MRYKIEIDFHNDTDMNVVLRYDDEATAWFMANEFIKQGYYVRICGEFEEDD